MKNVLIASLMLLILISGCISQTSEEEYNESEINDITEETENVTVVFDKDTAVAECKSLCQEFLNEGVDLSKGPCLSDNNENWIVTDWVCDVAHSPRSAIDEYSENQCLEFRTNRAHHFVEVDENCDLIRVY